MKLQPELSLSDWNWAVLMLTQAMLGFVSPNFRMVELAFEEMKWVVRITLRDDSGEDREEIDDLCDEFSIYLDDVRDRISPEAYAEIIADVVVSQAPIFLSPRSASGPRLIFRMREK